LKLATPRVLASSKEKFDLVCFMDSLHDMGDPLEAVWASRQAMDPDGVLMLVNRSQRTVLRRTSAR
jgi:2-polyprenyl-3-methyl-5-hydroxy-6-metoxy-1,4-benzoquinol methylase